MYILPVLGIVQSSLSPNHTMSSQWSVHVFAELVQPISFTLIPHRIIQVFAGFTGSGHNMVSVIKIKIISPSYNVNSDSLTYLKISIDWISQTTTLNERTGGEWNTPYSGHSWAAILESNDAKFQNIILFLLHYTHILPKKISKFWFTSKFMDILCIQV